MRKSNCMSRCLEALLAVARRGNEKLRTIYQIGSYPTVAAACIGLPLIRRKLQVPTFLVLEPILFFKGMQFSLNLLVSLSLALIDAEWIVPCTGHGQITMREK